VQTFHGTALPGDHTRAAAEGELARLAAVSLVAAEDDVFPLVRLGADRRRIRIAPFGVDLTEFAPAGPVLNRPEHPRLVAVGGLDETSGVDDLVAALASVPRAELLVGGGPATGEGRVPGRDPDLRRVHKVADAHGVARRVRFLGAVPRRHLAPLYRSADLVVHVPREARFGSTALEAMACERAVVASEVAGLRDVVVDGVTGVLVPPSRPDVLGRTLRGLIGEQAVTTAFGIAGRDRAANRYSWSRIAEQVGAAYAVAAQPVVAEADDDEAPDAVGEV
jgi:glycosyltransferase involved in cell wall biosynthesis